jgi:hypothetical protein
MNQALDQALSATKYAKELDADSIIIGLNAFITTKLHFPFASEINSNYSNLLLSRSQIASSEALNSLRMILKLAKTIN